MMMMTTTTMMMMVILCLLSKLIQLLGGWGHISRTSFSPNLLHDDMLAAYDVTSHVIRQPLPSDDYQDLSGNGAGNSAQYYPQSLVLKRGSHLTIRVKIRDLCLTSLYRAVDHSDDGDEVAEVRDDDESESRNRDKDFTHLPFVAGTQRERSQMLVRMFCPQPVPEMYNLTLEIVQIPCSKSRFGDLAKGTTNGGVLVNETQNALLCPKSSGLYHLLGIADTLFSEYKVDDDNDDDVFGNKQDSKDDRQSCSSINDQCHQCLKLCALVMTSRMTGHRCNVTKEDGENPTPKLPTCLSCCARGNCFNQCLAHQNSGGKPTGKWNHRSHIVEDYDGLCLDDDPSNPFPGNSSHVVGVGGKIVSGVIMEVRPPMMKWDEAKVIRLKGQACHGRGLSFESTRNENNGKCKSKRCPSTKAVKLKLKPIFPNKKSVFACHVTHSTGNVIYDIEYDVYYDDQLVNGDLFKSSRSDSKSTFKAKRHTGPKGNPYRTVDDHNFLRIHYGSNLNTFIDLVEGDYHSRSFSAGRYVGNEASDGRNDSEGKIRAKLKSGFALVRPKHPFTISSKSFGSNGCDRLDWMSHLTPAVDHLGHPFHPYDRQPDVVVEPLSKHVYRLYHRLTDMRPYLFLEIPKDRSIFRHLSNETLLLVDETLSVNLTWINETSTWILSLFGQVDRCPGVLQIKVSEFDWSTGSQSMIAFYDVIVKCPRNFEVTFAIDEKKPKNMLTNQTFVVVVKDSFRSTRLVAYQPIKTLKLEPITDTSPRKNKSLNVTPTSATWTMTSIIIIIAANTSTFTVFIFASFSRNRRKPPFRKFLEKFPKTLIMISIVICRFFFSLFFTGTCFMTLTYHMSRDDMAKLGNATNVITSLIEYSHLKIQSIQSEAFLEIKRQNSMANQTRLKCFKKFEIFQNKINKIQMRISEKSRMKERHFVANLTSYVEKLFENIDERITFYRSNFLNTTIPIMAHEFNNEVGHSMTSVLNSHWLKPARILYGAVQEKRSKHGLKSKTFLEFLGLKELKGKMMNIPRVHGDQMHKDYFADLKSQFADVISSGFKNLNSNSNRKMKMFDANLPHNYWSVQTTTASPLANITKPLKNNSSVKDGIDGRMETNLYWKYVFLTVLAVDCIFFVLRMIKTWRLIEYFRSLSSSLLSQDDLLRGNNLCLSTKQNGHTCMDHLHIFITKLWQADYISKLIISSFALLVLTFLVKGSNGIISSQLFSNAGHLDAIIHPIERSHAISSKLVELNQRRINDFELQVFSELTVSRMRRLRVLLAAYSNLEWEWRVQAMAESCYWRDKMVHLIKSKRRFRDFKHFTLRPRLTFDPNEAFNEGHSDDLHSSSSSSDDLNFEPCLLTPVDLRPLKRLNHTQEKSKFEVILRPVMKTLDAVVAVAAQLLLLFVAVWSGHDNLCNVLWTLVMEW